jgi:hypothetical protein
MEASVEAHEGAVPLLVRRCRKDGFLTGGDDGRVMSASPPTARVEELQKLGTMKWVEHVAAIRERLRAASVGKQPCMCSTQGRGS